MEVRVHDLSPGLPHRTLSRRTRLLNLPLAVGVHGLPLGIPCRTFSRRIRVLHLPLEVRVHGQPPGPHCRILSSGARLIQLPLGVGLHGLPVGHSLREPEYSIYLWESGYTVYLTGNVTFCLRMFYAHRLPCQTLSQRTRVLNLPLEVGVHGLPPG
ncbi:hypothetical protein J6590_019576 [Homalodisca vitripennis]|nr:hypothetical protein J6590_019576 [Homalodisca vitripennis]